MKVDRRDKGKVTKDSAEGMPGIDCAVLKRAKRPLPKAGQPDRSLQGSDGNPLPFMVSKALCPEQVEKVMEAPESAVKPELNSGKVLQPSKKIKLQLFPIDEGTRMGLEKDGYHPYLELSLTFRKKISSVLERLNRKWGCSKIAKGEPILYPYDREKDASKFKLTMSNRDVTAGDVYVTLGNPAVFRLRYGWIPSIKTTTDRMISIPSSSEECFPLESIKKSNVINMESTYGQGMVNDIRSGEQAKPTIVSEATKLTVNEDMFSDPVVQSKDTGMKISPELVLWDDNMTTISLGGLFSEASMQGRLKSCDKNSNGSKAGQQSTFFDSLDAFFASQVNQSQGSRPNRLDSHSSILDAEDTCHAFASRRFSSSQKDSVSSGGNCRNTTSWTFGEEKGSKEFKFPKFSEACEQTASLQGHGSQVSETNLFVSSRTYNDERSLGLSGIKWTESLGPFDLGLSFPRKLVNGDSMNNNSNVAQNRGNSGT